MKILYLAHRIPYPPNKGDKIRSFHEIEHLSREHEIHLLAFCDQPEDLQYADNLRHLCKSVTLVPMNRPIQKMKAGVSILFSEPFTLGYFSSGQMRAAVRRTLAEHRFDLIFVFSSSMAPYVEKVERIPKVLDFVDSDACKWSQYAQSKGIPAKWLYGYEADRLKEFEIRMLERFDCSVFVSAREGAHLSGRSLDKVMFIQNGIDLDFYGAMPRVTASRTIVFTGAMDYFPNIDAVKFFAEDVFPRVRSVFQDARFVIVGSNPSPEVLRLAALPGVTVTGTVKDVRPYLADAQVAVVPLRISQGIQNKVLEALATGLPVVVSPAAAAGLTPMQDVPLVVAGDAAAFAERVTDFLRQPPFTLDRIQLCRRQLREHYDWTTNLSVLEDRIQKLIPTADATPLDLEAHAESPMTSQVS